MAGSTIQAAASSVATRVRTPSNAGWGSSRTKPPQRTSWAIDVAETA
ncbi:hypothetical protein AB0H30_28215 [Streptomyces pseudogriseolus]